MDLNLINVEKTNFDQRFNGMLNNTGHTVQFIPDSETATFTNHVGMYTLKQLHFHWGQSTVQLGSEHTIDGSKFSGEMHNSSPERIQEARLLGMHLLYWEYFL